MTVEVMYDQWINPDNTVSLAFRVLDVPADLESISRRALISQDHHGIEADLSSS